MLADRLWPKDFRKEALWPFLWAKDAAPSLAIITVHLKI
ncbi:DUF488 family protein, N3 subclade [Christensenella intestinihominis]